MELKFLNYALIQATLTEFKYMREREARPKLQPQPML